MPNYKLVINYEFGKQGWDEVFYKSSDLTAEVLAASFGPSAGGGGGGGGSWGSFVQVATNLRAPGVTLTSVTASDEATPFLASKHTYNFTQGAVAGAAPDVTNTAVRCILNATGGRYRHLWLRGLNDTWTIRTAAGAMNLAPALTSYIQQYLAEIISQQFAVKRMGNQTSYPWFNVTSVAPMTIDGTKYLSFTSLRDPAYPVGSVVSMSRFPQTVFGGLKGNWKIIKVVGGAMAVNYPWLLGDNATPSVTGARVRAAAFNYPLIANAQIQALATHDTGRPTNLPRGRRRGLRIRR